jgi:IclR family pca regulon transcriptional regulator
MRETILQARVQGWALIDEELELGLRSVAAPIRRRDGRTVAALNVSGSVARVSLTDLRERFLPELLATTEQISLALIRRSAAGS